MKTSKTHMNESEFLPDDFVTATEQQLHYKTKNILREYDTLCDRILQKFIDTYFICGDKELSMEDYYDGYLENWVGRDPGGVACIGDYFVSMGNMVTCLRHNIISKAFFDWYDVYIDTEADCPNLENFWIIHKEQYIS